ncbi:hypothetical protein, partial [uncultured Roseovarius sp.]|uniref:hypothetical protein n=1 Tax=uncultured Roseovarius sp. TaxID=293344 RepID=UPI002609C2D3
LGHECGGHACRAGRRLAARATGRMTAFKGTLHLPEKLGYHALNDSDLHEDQAHARHPRDP